MQKGLLQTLFREPLLHFFLLGLILFVLDRALNSELDNDKLILVNAETKNELIATFTKGQGRAPSENELDTLIDTWLKNELLYREGLNLGLDQGDPVIRERIIHKMLLLVMNSVVIDSPTEEQLRDWFEKHRFKYDKPARYDFAVISFKKEEPDSKLQAQKILTVIQSENKPDNIDHLARSYRKRPREKVVKLYGEGFVQALENEELHQWQVIESTVGWHAVRLDGIEKGKRADFDSWRWKVENDWQQYRHKQLADEALQEIQTSYDVELKG